MKKIKLLFIAAIFPVLIYSQGIELVPFAGYMFGGSIRYVEGKANLENSGNYDLSILVPVQPLVDVEINYTRMTSKGSFTPYTGYPGLEYAETTIATNYFQIGGISKFYKGNDKVAPFGSLSIGATWFSADEISDIWRFSATVGLGVKIMASDRVGFMLRGRLMMPMNFAGTSIYIGTGGSGLSMNAVVAPLQGDFDGGLIIKVGY